MPQPHDPIDDLLRRDAARVRPRAATGFAERVRAAREASDQTPLPFPTGQRQTVRAWPWLAAAAAALLLAGAGWLLQNRDPSTPASGANTAAPELASPTPTPAATAPAPERPTPPTPATTTSGAPPSLAMLDLTVLVPSPADPLGAEADAFREDLRHTGAFLLACLPDYPQAGR